MKEEVKICEIVLILRENGVNKSIDELYLIAKEILKSIDHPTEKGGEG
jgi:hypothetical protein